MPRCTSTIAPGWRSSSRSCWASSSRPSTRRSSDHPADVVSELHGGDYYTWVVTVYLLTSTVTVPIYGKLSDLSAATDAHVGVGLFLLGSALSGLSQDDVAARSSSAASRASAPAPLPDRLAVIGDLFTPAERGKYQGLFGAVFGIASSSVRRSAAS